MIKDTKPPVGTASGHRHEQSEFAARLARCYANEGLALLGEGVAAQAIEAAAREAGMAWGPLALLDEMSLQEADRLLHEAMENQHADHSHGHGHGHEHEHEHAHAHGHGHGHEHEHEHEHEHRHGHAHAHSDQEVQEHDHAHPAGAQSPPSHGMTEEAIYVLEKMAHGFGRMGRSSGRGFYDYEDGEDPELWSGLEVFVRRRNSVAAEDLRDRLLYVQAIAALRCLDQGLLASADEAERASRSADWAFRGATGGVISFLRKTGVQAFTARAGELASRYGERFDPAGLFAARTASAGVFGEQA